MIKLNNLISRLKTFEEELIQVIEKSIRDNEDFILALNTDDQLYGKGIRRDGTPVTPEYTAATVALKKIKNQPTGRVTLKDEGDFHESFYIEYYPDGFEIKASDEKEPALVYKYGEEIFGLTDENLKLILERFVAPAIFQKLKEL